MYRLYDHKLGEWVKDDFYVSFFGDVYLSKKTMFGNDKMYLVSDNRYTLHQDIGAYDVNNKLIFEGDICRNCHNHDIVGVVGYYPEQAAYLLFEPKYDAKYRMNAVMIDTNSRSEMEIIGNVFDDADFVQELLEKNGMLETQLEKPETKEGE